jgi:CheY-like chemotaxis protein
MAYKVLLIEDNTDCRELFAMMVRQLGFQVLQADDGELGVQQALSEKPDLIFMDVGMPNMDGIEATCNLRENSLTKETPIVICTAWMGAKYRDAALKSGAQEVVMKPISYNDLQGILLRYLPVPTEPAHVYLER